MYDFLPDVLGLQADSLTKLRDSLYNGGQLVVPEFAPPAQAFRLPSCLQGGGAPP